MSYLVRWGYFAHEPGLVSSEDYFPIYCHGDGDDDGDGDGGVGDRTYHDFFQTLIFESPIYLPLLLKKKLFKNRT